MVHASTQRTALFCVALLTSAGTAPALPPAPARIGPVTNLTGNWRLFVGDVHISHTSSEVTRSFHSFARAPAPFLSLAANENLALGASGVFPYHSVLPPDPSPSCSPSADCAQWRLWYDCWRDVWGVRTFLTPAPVSLAGVGRGGCHRCATAFTVWRFRFLSWRVVWTGAHHFAHKKRRPPSACAPSRAPSPGTPLLAPCPTVCGCLSPNRVSEGQVWLFFGHYTSR